MTNVRTIDGITFADVDGKDLKLNVYRPGGHFDVPAVIYLHGGGWQNGDRYTDAETRAKSAAAHGLAAITVDYRLAPGAVYPAQIHDVKAVVRWVRGAGPEHGLRTEKVGVWGSSAGAMLGSLAALTAGDGSLEGTLGEHTDQSSAIDAIVHWCGPSDFVTTATRTPLEARLLPPSAESVMLAAAPGRAAVDDARIASPITHVRRDSPPILIVHGDRDRLTPHADAQAFHAAFSRVGAQAMLVSVAGAGHDDPRFESGANIAMTMAFLTTHLSH
jgi:acetyl esterase/lipase